ncbi:hypothetical protein I4U23_027505 [Adineta vaga]|nr:hypothetical protein I4U23_027505 [Adineta vaga]
MRPTAIQITNGNEVHNPIYVGRQLLLVLLIQFLIIFVCTFQFALPKFYSTLTRDVPRPYIPSVKPFYIYTLTGEKVFRKALGATNLYEDLDLGLGLDMGLDLDLRIWIWIWVWVLEKVFIRRVMATLNVPPTYPESTKPAVGQAWSSTTAVQNVQQSQTYPMTQSYIVHHPVHFVDPTIAQIRDWLPWSIINMFIGGILLGLLPLSFSIICRNHKRSNNASGARTMSTLALVFNILITLIGLALWITLIVLIVQANRVITTCLTYPYC